MAARTAAASAISASARESAASGIARAAQARASSRPSWPCRRTQGSRHDPQPLAAINAAADAFPPAAIGEIPLDRLAQPGLECLARLPVEFGGDLRGVDGVAQIVPGRSATNVIKSRRGPILLLGASSSIKRADRLDHLQICLARNFRRCNRCGRQPLASPPPATRARDPRRRASRGHWRPCHRPAA